MSPRDQEQVQARLANIRALLEEIERVCQASSELRETFVKLQQQIYEASLSLRPITRGLHDPNHD